MIFCGLIQYLTGFGTSFLGARGAGAAGAAAFAAVSGAPITGDLLCPCHNTLGLEPGPG